MKITFEKQPKCLGQLTVAVPTEAVNEERKTLIKGYSKQAKIKGYRPGKVPRSVIEKMFAKDIANELDGRLINQAIDKAIKDEDLRVLDVQTPENATHQADGSFTFDIKVVLAPEIELPEYKGLEIEIPSSEVKDEQIDEEIEKIRHQLADFNEITDRALAMEDLAIIDFKTTCEGQSLDELLGKPAGVLGGKEDYWIKMDDETFLPGFCSQLVGMKSSETHTAKSTVPEDFPVPELIGKELDVEVTLKKIQEEILPELDDELAAKVVPGKSLEELRELISEEIGKQLEQRVQEAKADQVVEALISKTEFDLPEDILKRETQQQADRIVAQGAQQGVSGEELEAQQTALFAEAGNRASASLKSTFILQQVAEVEKIEVPQAELLGRIQEMAQYEKKSPKALIKELQKNDRIRDIHYSMLISKAIDFLVSEAKITEVEPTAEADA